MQFVDGPYRHLTDPTHPELKEWKEWYIPPDFVSRTDLILDVGARDGDSCLFYLVNGYTNLRLIEPCSMYFDWLDKNVEEMRVTFPGVKIDVRKKAYSREDLEGVAFVKFDCEGCESEVDLDGIKIPWVAEIHYPVKKLDHGIFEYMPAIGYKKWVPRMDGV